MSTTASSLPQSPYSGKMSTTASSLPQSPYSGKVGTSAVKRTKASLADEYRFVSSFKASEETTLYLVPAAFLQAWKQYVLFNGPVPQSFDSTPFKDRELNDLLQSGTAIGVSLNQYILFKKRYGGHGCVHVLNYSYLAGALNELKVAPENHICCRRGCRGMAVGCFECEGYRRSNDLLDNLEYGKSCGKHGGARSDLRNAELEELAPFVAGELKQENHLLAVLKNERLPELQDACASLGPASSVEHMSSFIGGRSHDAAQILQANPVNSANTTVSRIIGSAHKRVREEILSDQRSLTAMLQRMNSRAAKVPKFEGLAKVVTYDDAMAD